MLFDTARLTVKTASIGQNYLYYQKLLPID